jgi:hypothetical protein
MCVQYWKTYIAAEGTDPFDAIEDSDLQERLGIDEMTLRWTVRAARPSPGFVAVPEPIARENAVGAAKELLARHPEYGNRIRAQYVDACGGLVAGEITLTIDNNFQEPPVAAVVYGASKARIAQVFLVSPKK